MLSPNTTAKTSTGTATKMAEVGPSRPNSFDPTPYWNTSTISPKVALTDRVFMMMALIGTSTERKAMASISPVAPRISTLDPAAKLVRRRRASHDDMAGFIAAATATGSVPSGRTMLRRASMTVCSAIDPTPC